MLSRKVLVGFFACLALAPTPAFAADVGDEAPPAEHEISYPNIVIEGSAELQFDDIRPRLDPSARISQTFAKIEPEISVNFSENFRLFTHLVYEPVTDPAPGDIQWLHDEGLYVEELEGIATIGDVNVGFGKIDPTFGLASDDAPGVYGFDFADSYQYLGGLGVRADWKLSSRQATGADGKAATIKQTLHAAVFDADTTFLSRSVFIDRGRLSRADGGIGNSQLPGSFSVAYDIRTENDEGDANGPSARLAIRRLAGGMDGGPDEWGFLANVEDIFVLGDERSLKAIGELAYFSHEAGGDNNAVTATIGAELREGPWTQSLTVAAHDATGGEFGTDTLLTASFGRDFEFGSTGSFRVDAAYALAHVDGEDANTFGLRLHKELAWSSQGE